MSKNGPANYPAGFLYIYTVISWIVGGEFNLTGNYLHILLHLVYFYFVFSIYEKLKVVPPIAIFIFDRFTRDRIIVEF